jgi:hypothetical protein
LFLPLAGSPPATVYLAAHHEELANLRHEVTGYVRSEWEALLEPEARLKHGELESLLQGYRLRRSACRGLATQRCMIDLSEPADDTQPSVHARPNLDNPFGNLVVSVRTNTCPPLRLAHTVADLTRWLLDDVIQLRQKQPRFNCVTPPTLILSLTGCYLELGLRTHVVEVTEEEEPT